MSYLSITVQTVQTGQDPLLSSGNPRWTVWTVSQTRGRPAQSCGGEDTLSSRSTRLAEAFQRSRRVFSLYNRPNRPNRPGGAVFWLEGWKAALDGLDGFPRYPREFLDGLDG